MAQNNWKIELRAWANQVAKEFANREGVLGVIMGGSIARGQEWQHSDLELGILVAERLPEMPYFNVIDGRGVEAIQLVQAELEAQVSAAEDGDCLPFVQWPIQLWKGRIIHDPSGLLARFKAQFDPELFKAEVIDQRIHRLCGEVSQRLDEARDLLAKDRPAAALVRTREAMNEAILAFHWAHGELPRSQSRTDSRLRLVCRRHGAMDFYALYRDVFDLHDANRIIRKTWPRVKEPVLEIARLWGNTARDFFLYAVDGNFQWRQNAGILTVYRLYIPVIGAPRQAIFDRLDDPQWAAEHYELMAFLGLAGAREKWVAELIERVEKVVSFQ